MDASQEAAAARDKLLDQQAESEAELKALRAKATRQAAAVAAAADAEERVMAAETKSKSAHADAASWQTQVCVLRESKTNTFLLHQSCVCCLTSRMCNC